RPRRGRPHAQRNGPAFDARASVAARRLAGDRHGGGAWNRRLCYDSPLGRSRHCTLGEVMPGDVIRVVLADDHSVVRAGLRAVLGVAKDIEVIGEAKTGREAVAMAERFKPDVVVMDLGMPDLDGTAATKEIVAKELPV